MLLKKAFLPVVWLSSFVVWFTVFRSFSEIPISLRLAPSGSSTACLHTVLFWNFQGCITVHLSRCSAPASAGRFCPVRPIHIGHSFHILSRLCVPVKTFFYFFYIFFFSTLLNGVLPPFPGGGLLLYHHASLLVKLISFSFCQILLKAFYKNFFSQNLPVFPSYDSFVQVRAVRICPSCF